MSAITWIVIILILVSILVTLTEVGLRFAMLERSKKPGEERSPLPLPQVSWADGATPNHAPPLRIGPGPAAAPAEGEMPSALEELARTLGLEANATLDDVKSSIRTLQDEAASLPAPEGVKVDEL